MTDHATTPAAAAPSLQDLGLFDKRVPRYTSYPTAPAFSQHVGAGFQSACLAGLDPRKPVSVYLHIPFCERLCWFCACRTQGTTNLAPVEVYVATLRAELELMRKVLPKGLRMGQMHWGGGTPTILPPDLIDQLAQAVKDVIPPAPNFEFSVEIDPTLVSRAKIDALRRHGFNRASLGVQDFRAEVQSAIGRDQSFEQTKDCLDMVRAAGVRSLNIDLVYGLPHQTPDSIAQTTQQVLALDPDRLALFGYAHVPWMAKRQKLIDEAALPDDRLRHALFNQVSDGFVQAGYAAIGIDHFAKPTDSMTRCQQQGALRRNFQGYTADPYQTLIGLGASSISRFRQGYMQNASATLAYTQHVEAGSLPGFRGHAFTKQDRADAAAIEMLMCDFRIDFARLAQQAPAKASALAATHAHVARTYAGFVTLDAAGLTILPKGRPLTRIIAREYDRYSTDQIAYSRAS